MDPLEAAFYEMCGYIPVNIQACRDYTAGKITQQEMWRIILRNIKIKGDYVQEEATPRKDDIVRKYNSDNDLVYGKISWINRSDDVVQVYWFLEKEAESFSLDDFAEYSSKGGRTTWIMQDD